MSSSPPPKHKTTTAELALHFVENRTDPTSSSPSLMSQLAHRQELIAYWDVHPGSHVLEIGCGQGDTTIALADAVGENGTVVALDPGSPDYGSPQTLAQAQAHILTTPLGQRIKFHFTPPIAYLNTYTGPPFTHIVLSHCIYYFASPLDFPLLLSAILPHFTASGQKLCIAEWSLHASTLNQVPHVLTALLWSTLETKRGEESSGNVRTVLSPQQIQAAVLTAKVDTRSQREGVSELAFKLVKQATLPSNPGLQDPFWEVNYLLSTRDKEIAALRKRKEGGFVSDAEIVVIEAAYDTVTSLVDSLEDGVKGVKCMDYWVGVFESV
ncbi:uncharacterized protein RSE6_14872 [Rhynchosporium secalis]|uniref:Methyltransferase domain-containing protein n=1 Tax=Rhynchosporium secalis TaxID=38038 RepID=A0A1E1MWC4_RHYSE|nr:uncharacterized protein RSE6_14872 [Rhynchosporium secalis]